MPSKRHASVHPTLDFPRPLVSVDLVIFTLRPDPQDPGSERLALLLVKRPEVSGEPFPGQWALPGGFVDVARDADLESCARRKLKEKTGVASPYLEQLGSFGDNRRDPRGWSTTHVYFCLMASQDVQLMKGENATDVAWVPVEGPGAARQLAFDHAALAAAALERLRAKVEYTSLPAFLLPGEFTLSELQRVYEIVLDRPLEKKAFRTRVLSTRLVTEVPRQRTGATRPAQLYRLTDPGAPVFFARTFSPRG